MDVNSSVKSSLERLMNNKASLETRIPEKPLEIKKYVTIALFIILIISSGIFTDFSASRLIENADQAGDILSQMFLPPDLSYARRLLGPLLETIQMSIIGTTLGAILAIPLAIFSARNFIENRWLNGFFRNVLGIFRTIPAMALAAIFAAVFGFGSFSGMLALMLFTMGLVAKLGYESIENIDRGAVEALEASGASKLSILRYAIIPQVLPAFFSYTLYGFEVNIRAAAVLGYVGAGGIGEYYNRTLSYFKYDRAGTIVIMTFVIVLLIDLLSSKIREKLV